MGNTISGGSHLLCGIKSFKIAERDSEKFQIGEYLDIKSR